MKKAASLLFAACLVFVLAMAQLSVAEEADQGALITDACTSCHSLKLVCAKISKYDQEEWVETIQSMQSKGADVADEQIAPMAAFLAAQEKGSSPLCE